MTNDCGGAKQQISLIELYEHRQSQGVRGRLRQSQRGVNEARRDMLQEQIVAILLDKVLTHVRHGERISSGPVSTAGLINEFRSIFSHNLQRTSDPALTVITSPNGTRCVVKFRCTKVLLQALGLHAEDLLRGDKVPWPADMTQPSSQVMCGPGKNELRITYRRRTHEEFGELESDEYVADSAQSPSLDPLCTCGDHRRSRKRGRKKSPTVSKAPEHAEAGQLRNKKSYMPPAHEASPISTGK